MKLYEWVLTLICVTLIYTGIAIWPKHPGMSAGAFLTVAILFSGYMYFVKTAPMKRLGKLFVETATRNGFKPLNDKSTCRNISNIIKQFPGFDDLFLTINELYCLEKSKLYFAGKYHINGYGINSGYFLLIDLTQNTEFPSIRFSRFVDMIDKLNENGERTIVNLPDEVLKLLRTFPYDLHCIDRHWLIDFDARNLNKDNFQASFNKVLNVFNADK
jgi:hypothetical protein